MRVHVCIYVYFHLPRGLHICLEQLEYQRTDQRCCVEDVIISVKSLPHYFRMRYRVFLTSHFILFTPKATSRVQTVRPSFTIIRNRPRSALHSNIVTDLPLVSDTHERGLNLTRNGYNNYKPEF